MRRWKLMATSMASSSSRWMFSTNAISNMASSLAMRM
jgi:hypothetical protein